LFPSALDRPPSLHEDFISHRQQGSPSMVRNASPSSSWAPKSATTGSSPDHHLRALMDDVLGRQIARSKRRQVASTIVVRLLSLLTGWLVPTMSLALALKHLL
jgi:hypothetical protein